MKKRAWLLAGISALGPWGQGGHPCSTSHSDDGTQRRERLPDPSSEFWRIRLGLPVALTSQALTPTKRVLLGAQPECKHRRRSPCHGTCSRRSPNYRTRLPPITRCGRPGHPRRLPPPLDGAGLRCRAPVRNPLSRSELGVEGLRDRLASPATHTGARLVVGVLVTA